jgi:hypothetical protein
MKVSKAGKIWLDYHRSIPKKILSEPTRSSRIDCVQMVKVVVVHIERGCGAL